MALSKQRKQILKILYDIDEPASASDIKNIYEEKHQEIGNVHAQLSRLLDDRYVSRTEGGYKITDNGTYVFEEPEEKEEKHKVIPVNFTETQVDEFEEMASQDGWLDTLTTNFNSRLMGLRDEKLAVLAAFVSSNDIHGYRNRISILLYGEPSTGKSQLIKYLNRCGLGKFINHDTAKSGLRGSAKGSVYKSGELVFNDRGCLLIDELDKFSKSDQDALLSSIEDGKVYINIEEVRDDYDARVRCVATCNKYNKIIDELKSRFDLKLKFKPLSEDDKDTIIIRRANNWNREDTTRSEIGKKKFANFLKYAKRYNTKLPEDRQRLIDVIMQAREGGTLSGRDPRERESVFRLPLAIAKLRLHDVVKVEDVETALALLDKSK